MPNSGVTGSIRGESGQAVEGVRVRVRATTKRGPEAILAVARWVPGGLESSLRPCLAETTTGLGGAFHLHYPALDEPDLDVVLHTASGRRLSVTQVEGVIDQTLDVGTLTIRDDALGWVPRNGSFPPRDDTGVEPIVDNHDAWARAVTLVKGAHTSINVMLFYLDVGTSRMTFTPDPPTPGQPGPTGGETLEQALKDAAGRGVTVRLLLNDLAGIPYPLDTAYLVHRYFTMVTGVETRRFTNVPLAPVHAKIMIVDDTTAIEQGSPFVQDYYDDVGHRLRDPRRGGKQLSKGIQVPTHDVNTVVTGPAVKDLNETFRLHWNQAKPTGAIDLPAAATPSPVTNGVTAQVTRSIWGASHFSELPDGELSILESYLRAIEHAEHYIYLENQYFTLRELTDALVTALKAKPNLQLILLTNNKVDIPFYGPTLFWGNWHPQNVTRLLTGLHPDHAGQVGVFTRWSYEKATDGKRRVGRNYVHSKLAIVDDVWLTVGSANLDGVSLLAGEHLARLAGVQPNEEEIRETDVNLLVLDVPAGGATATTLPVDMRKRLFAEHLGYLTGGRPDPTAPEVQAPPAGGWLALWNERALANVAAIKTGGEPHQARVLPWPHTDGVTITKVEEPARYLAGLAAKPPREVEIVEHFDYFSFQKNDWE